MKIKKDLIVVALTTFCLTATLFMVTSTRSQTPSASQTPLGTYDPLIDNNHDGQINILDAIILADHFMTSGDPTINVNVMNFPIAQEQIVFWNQNNSAQSVRYNASGFGHLHITWYAFGDVSWTVTFRLLAIIPFPNDPLADQVLARQFVSTQANISETLSCEVPSELFMFSVDVPSGTMYARCAFYLTYA